MNQVRHIEFAQYGVTNLHAAAIVFMAIMAILVFAPKRTTAAVAVLSVCIFMPMAQRVVIGGLDFPMSRLIAIIAALRVLIKGEHHGLAIGKLDHLVLYWVLSGSVFGILRVGMSGLVPSLGHAFDVIGSYLIMRLLVRTPGEVLSVWKQVAWIVIVLSPLLFYEMQTRHNLFGVFTYEGVDIAAVRNGKVRARGPISHPILAGTFGAVVIPVFIGIFRGQKKSRGLMAVACVAATIIAVASGSSGPLITWGVGLLGWMLWVLRGRIRAILWGMTSIAVVIHLVRDKPVWHLILRLSNFMGGTGYHRYNLIDAFIGRFGEWALVGTDNTINWGWGLQDTTNQYVVEGVNGGLVTLVLFILVLRVSFVQLRLSRIAYERLGGPRSGRAQLAWGCSVSLAAHCVSFVSVSYFGQMYQFFVFFVAMVPAMSSFSQGRRASSRVQRSTAKSPDRRRQDMPAKAHPVGRRQSAVRPITA